MPSACGIQLASSEIRIPKELMAMKHRSLDTGTNRAACTLATDPVSAFHISLYGDLAANTKRIADIDCLHQHGFWATAIYHFGSVPSYVFFEPIGWEPFVSGRTVIRIK
jgi:hypothetical protein